MNIDNDLLVQFLPNSSKFLERRCEIVTSQFLTIEPKDFKVFQKLAPVKSNSKVALAVLLSSEAHL